LGRGGITAARALPGVGQVWVVTIEIVGEGGVEIVEVFGDWLQEVRNTRRERMMGKIWKGFWGDIDSTSFLVWYPQSRSQNVESGAWVLNVLQSQRVYTERSKGSSGFAVINELIFGVALKWTRRVDGWTIGDG
jgi:hypothetical protein